MSKTMLKRGEPDSVDTAARRLSVLLNQAKEVTTSRFKATLRSHDLTDQQWRVLSSLSEVTGIDTQQLADETFLLGPSVSRIVKDLAARELITMSDDLRDARRTLHFLAPSGHALATVVKRAFDPVYGQLIAEAGDTVILELAATLDRYVAALELPPQSTEE